MKKFILVIAIFSLFIQCDDGDFDVPSFVFEDNIDYCGDLVIHNIGQDDSEVLILDINESNEDDIFFKTAWTDKEYSLTDKIYYRVFDDVVDSDYFCQEIPPSSPNIVNEWIGSGTLIVNNTIIEDDQDGIPALEEDLNGDGNLDNDDFDQDGIPNYLDIDDDNDGVLTEKEIKINDDGSVSFLDTDDDGIPNHLDTNDDGDSVLTINESDNNSDGDFYPNGDIFPDYLNINAQTPQPHTRVSIPNKHNLQYTMSFVIENMSLVNSSGNAINYTNYEYGVKVDDIPITD